MFSLRWSIIIIIILFIPFCLRTFTGIEPYPAVLLPSGAASIKKVGDSVALSFKEVFGIDSAGNWQKINMPLFLAPVPTQYLPMILSHDFGVDKGTSFYKSRRFKILKKLNLAEDDGTTNEEKTIEVKKWIKERLGKQHLAASKIKVTSYIKTISAATGSILKNEIKDERTILLDE